MPITAYTMLVGCLAIAGIGIPFVLGFSGFHSKDAIVEQAINFGRANGGYSWLFVVLPLLGALMTSFYMFRLWFMTFAGKPRDHHRYDHAHESAAGDDGSAHHIGCVRHMRGLVTSVSDADHDCQFWRRKLARPGPARRYARRQARNADDKFGGCRMRLASHAPEIKVPAGISAICVAVAGILGALIVYVWELVSVDTLRRSVNVLYRATWNKWWFDELYDYVFVRPTLAIGRFVALTLDRGIIDSFINSLAYIYRGAAAVVSVVGDRWVIDNFVDTVAEKTWGLGLSMRAIQTGRLRQYVMFIVVGTVVLFIVASLWWMGAKTYAK